MGSNERGNQTRQQTGQESGASLDASVAGSPSASSASTHARGPRLLFLLLLALVVLAPLPQGGREPWSAFLLIAWVGGMLTLACAATLVGSLGRSLGGTHDLWPPTSSMRVPILLFLGTCAWTAVQWMPWTPAALHHPLWADAEATLGQSLPGSISLNPGQTIASGLQLLAYGGVFVLALGLGRDAGRARRGLQVFVYASFAYALYGLIAFFSGSELILWFGERRGTVSLTSTFENRNSYATLAGMGLVAAFALFLDGLGSVLRARVPPRTRLRWTLHHIFGPAAPLLVATLVIATALLLTASRGGTLSSLFGLLVLAGAFSRAGALPARPVSIIVGAILLAGVLVFTLSGDHLAKRLELIDREMDGRTAVYKTVLGAVADAPLLGTGYGTFADVFPLYRPQHLPRERSGTRRPRRHGAVRLHRSLRPHLLAGHTPKATASRLPHDRGGRYSARSHPRLGGLQPADPSDQLRLCIPAGLGLRTIVPEPTASLGPTYTSTTTTTITAITTSTTCPTGKMSPVRVSLLRWAFGAPRTSSLGLRAR